MTLIRPTIVIFLLLTLITGAIYPAIVTALAQIAFPSRASGSIITRDGKSIGSSLIGQNFTDARYFWPRPSSAGSKGYDAANSAGSNLASSNPALADAVKQRVAAYRVGNTKPIPVELVTASASGFDPHISPAAADFQADRIACVRGMEPAAVRRLIAAQTEGRSGGILGDARINVLLLNLALDAAEPPVNQR